MHHKQASQSDMSVRERLWYCQMVPFAGGVEDLRSFPLPPVVGTAVGDGARLPSDATVEAVVAAIAATSDASNFDSPTVGGVTADDGGEEEGEDVLEVLLVLVQPLVDRADDGAPLSADAIKELVCDSDGGITYV
jgi:hypothetical protein